MVSENKNEQIKGNNDMNFSQPVPKTEYETGLDVIVFIHGGAFMFLSSTFFDASILMEKDVILVSMNYRLGPLG